MGLVLKHTFQMKDSCLLSRALVIITQVHEHTKAVSDK